MSKYAQNCFLYLTHGLRWIKLSGCLLIAEQRWGGSGGGGCSRRGSEQIIYFLDVHEKQKEEKIIHGESHNFFFFNILIKGQNQTVPHPNHCFCGSSVFPKHGSVVITKVQCTWSLQSVRRLFAEGCKPLLADIHYCSTTGKPTRSFATERVSLDSV